MPNNSEKKIKCVIPFIRYYYVPFIERWIVKASFTSLVWIILVLFLWTSLYLVVFYSKFLTQHKEYLCVFNWATSLYFQFHGGSIFQRSDSSSWLRTIWGQPNGSNAVFGARSDAGRGATNQARRTHYRLRASSARFQRSSCQPGG